MSLYTNLVSFWELEEASGTRVDAVVASGNDLTDNNTVTQQTGKVGNCAQFTGANSEFLSHASNASLQAGNIDFTIAMWAYLDSKFVISGVQKDAGGGGIREYALGYVGPGIGLDNFYFATGDGAGTHLDLLLSTASVNTSAWHYLVGWFTTADQTLHISIDDATAETQVAVNTPAAGAAQFNIAKQGGAGYWDGRIDQVGIWKRALTSGERTQLYNSGAGLSYAAMSPSVDTSVTPGVVALTITKFTPSLVLGTQVTPGVLALTTTKFTPSLVLGTQITPGVASLTITKFAPAIVLGTQITPGVKALTITLYAVTVTNGVTYIAKAAVQLTTQNIRATIEAAPRTVILEP